MSGGPQGVRHRRPYERGLAQRLEGDEGDAVGKVRGEVGCHCQGQAGLAYSAGPGQCHQRHVLPPQQGTDRREDDLAVDERGARCRQGSREVGERNEAERDLVSC